MSGQDIYPLEVLLEVVLQQYFNIVLHTRSRSKCSHYPDGAGGRFSASQHCGVEVRRSNVLLYVCEFAPQTWADARCASVIIRFVVVAGRGRDGRVLLDRRYSLDVAAADLFEHVLRRLLAELLLEVRDPAGHEVVGELRGVFCYEGVKNGDARAQQTNAPARSRRFGR